MLAILVFWTGYGWLVPVLAISILVAVQLTVDAIYGEGFYTANTWPKTAGLSLVALAIDYVAVRLKRRRLERLERGERPDRRGGDEEDSLYWIPMRWWALIALVVALLAAFGGWLPPPKPD